MQPPLEVEQRSVSLRNVDKLERFEPFGSDAAVVGNSRQGIPRGS